MVCSLCLIEISNEEETVIVDGKITHKSCSDEFESMMVDLKKIYEDTCPEDI